MKQDMTYSIRFPREIWKNFLKEMEMGTVSRFCRDAIIEKINREFSSEYADQQYAYHMEQAKEWKEKKKQSKADPQKVNDILRMAKSQFDEWMKSGRGDIMQFKRYLQSNIIPKLRAANCTDLSLDKIIEKLERGEKYE